MKKSEIVKLTGREFTSMLKKAYFDECTITKKEYDALLNFWNKNKADVDKRGGQQALIVE